MRLRVVRVGVVVCLCLVTAFGLVYFVRAVDLLGERASTHAGMTYDDREFGGGNSLVVDKRALYQMRALVPEDGSYQVVAGPTVDDATELTEQYIDQYARYFLMPRRPDTAARWILCYGCDPSTLERPTNVVWKNGGGISILEAAE